MAKQAVKVDDNKTQKEKNKQAISNINKTGTVSGQKSGVTGSKNVVTTNTDTSNLAGNNRQQALGTPKMSQPSKANVLGKQSTREQGKTFTPNSTANKVDRYVTKYNLQQNQSTLSSMADESTRKANNVVNAIDNFANKFVRDLATPTKRTQLRADYKANRDQQKFEQVHAENEQNVMNTTQEELSKMFDQNGNRIDHSGEINDLNNQIKELDATISFINDESMTAVQRTHRDELQKQLDYLNDLENRAQSIEEYYTYEQLRNNGDKNLASYMEMLSHKNDSIWERAGNALNHLGNETTNIIPTAFAQMRELGTANYADENIAQLEELHNAGEIDDATYIESLAQWQDYIDRYKSTNNDNLSQIIRANADQLSANTYYGASEIEKFCLQVGESTAQFLLHFALLGESATISMSLASGTERMNQLLLEGVDPQIAVQNGFLTGLVSYVTEKIGMDRFVNMMGTPFSADAIGSIIINQLKSGLSEGLEELAEGLVDPLIDSITLGTPYEVNGDELKMEFLLGGASGLLMAMGGTAIGTAQTAIQVNNALNARREIRANVQNEIGALVINNQYQKNLLIDEVNMLKKHFNSMTDAQKEVADQLIKKADNAINRFDSQTMVPGVTFSSDIPVQSTEAENNYTIYQTYTNEFNSELQFEQKINQTENTINNLLEKQLAIEEINNQTQNILNENGYNIDAEVFNSLNTEQQNKALVALDFANMMGMKVNVVNNLPTGVNGQAKNGVITIDGTKRPILYTLSHELTHGTESSKYYPALKKLVMENIEGDWKQIVEKKQADYLKGVNQELSFEEAEQEVVARYVEDKLGDEKFIEDLVRYNFSLASKIYQDLKAMGSDAETDQIRNAFEKAFADNYQNNLTSNRMSLDNKTDENKRATNIRSLRTVQDIDPLFQDIRNYDVVGENIPGERAYNEGFERAFNGYFSKQTGEALGQSAFSGTYGDAGPGLDYGRVDDTTYYRNETIDRIYEDVNQYEKYWNYAITNMNPRQFLYLTLQGYFDNEELFIDYFSNQIEPLNEGKMQRAYTGHYYGDGPIKLVIGKDNNGNLRVINHEGRHRSWAMVNDGVNQTPVVLSFSKSISPNDVNNAYINVETDTSVGNGYDLFEDRGTQLGDITLATNENIDEIREKYGPANEGKYYFSYDSEDNYGYHYGAKDLDLKKKSETLWQRGGRGTGAFGTGTYFFGNGRHEASYFTKDRTEHKVDFSDYNLFRPESAEQGYRLHRLFKELDDNYNNTGPKSVDELKQTVSDLINELNEVEYDLDGEAKLTAEEEADIRERLLNLGDSENYVDKLLDINRNENGGQVLADYLADELNDRYIEENAYGSKSPRSLEWAEDYEIMTNHIPELAEILGEDEDYIYDVVNEAIRSAEADTYKRDFIGGNYDSVGTRVLKKLGYEGIDVRDIKGLDNSTYGSVIYDLKPESVKYSFDSENGKINKENNDDFRKLQESSEGLFGEGSRGRAERIREFNDARVRQRVSRILRTELRARGYSDSDPNGRLKDTGDYKILKDVDGQTFHDFFNIARSYLPFGELVDLHPVETNEDWTGYNDTYNYLSSDGLSGFAITKDGDLISVFNASRKKGFLKAIAPFVKENAKTLDCYALDPKITGTNLPGMYEKYFGFKVDRTVDYDMAYDHDNIAENYNKPQIVYMYNPNFRQVAESGGGTKGPNGPTHVDGEVVDGYGEKRVQRFASSNMQKSQVLNESQKAQVREEIANGGFTYMGLINKVEVQRAREYMEKDGVDATYNSFMANNNPNVKSVVQGEVLLQELAKSNDKRWEDVASKLADDATIAGQFLQAYAIMQKLTPEGQIVAIKRNLSRMQQQADNKFGKNAPKLELNQKLLEDLKKAKTQEEAEEVREKIYNDLENQIPKTVRDVINSWRYLAMLGNPRTHIRNIVGNGVFSPAVDIKNAIGTVLESAVSKKLDYRTKAVLNPFSENDKALVEAGKKAYDVYKTAIEKGQKYEKTGFSDKTKIGRILNKLSDWNSTALDKEDYFFSKDRYARSYAEFLKANKLDPNNLSPEMSRRANDYALLEAQKATYRDANAVAEWLNELDRSNKKGLRMASYVKDAIMPFTKTPMNIVKRGVEYSPVGLLKTIVYDSVQLANGQINANEYIDSMASGLTGTGIALLGALLASIGLFRTKDDDSTRKQYFDTENGEQDYAIDLSPLGVEGTYTIDWASPVIMPFAIGAELRNAFEGMEGIGGLESAINAVADVSAKVMDPIMETSMLSSLQDALKAYSTSGGEWLGEMILSMASSYVQQMFPTLGGQIARTIDDTRRTTYPNNGRVDKTIKQIMNKIPWLSKKNQPYINRQGQEEKTEDLGKGWVGRAFLNMVSPGYYSSKDIDKYDEELYRLYENTTSVDAFPSSASSSVTYDKETYDFTPEQYTEWHKVRWQTETKYVNSFIDSDVYKNLSDEERVETIKDIRKYAQMVAKKDFLESHGIKYEDKKYDQAQGAIDNGIELYSFYDYLNNAGTKQAEKVEYLAKSGLSQKQIQYLYDQEGYKTSYEDVYKKVFGKEEETTKNSKGKSSRSNSTGKKSSGKVSGGTRKGKVSGGTSSARRMNIASPVKTNSIRNNSFMKAYSQTLNNRRNVSQGGRGSVVCPKCGNRVSAGSERCPVCGTKL